ncbi:MAG TPA: spore coat protein CotH, partial [Cyclobacteriaceae bacterium]
MVYRLVFMVLATLILTPVFSQTFTSSNLPIVLINTNGQTIVDDPKIEAEMAIIDNGPGMINNVNDLPNSYNGKIGIEIR